MHQIWCNSDHYSRSYGILKKIIARHLESASSTKLVFELDRTLSEKKADMRILEQFRLFFFSYRGHSTSWHIRAINRNKHFFQKFLREKREIYLRPAAMECGETYRSHPSSLTLFLITCLYLPRNRLD